MPLSYEELAHLSKTHPAWRLLRAESSPLILSFIDKVFVQTNTRVLDQQSLISKLEDELFSLRETEGENAFPRSAKEYIADWSQSEKGWLRKFYPQGSDEPHFDLTPSIEKVIAWIESLTSRTFIGTESRLLTIFELLRQMIHGTESDGEKRIEELERRKAQIESEIEAINQGDIRYMDTTALRDRFLQINTTARELLSDFRSVEENFRILDGQIREKIATWVGAKGALLEDFFGERDEIADSDQGKSFKAFWDFLMSPESQEELSELLEKIFDLDAIAGFSADKRLKRIHFDWLEAGEHTQRTVANLSQQLRRYLDNKVYLENKRIIDILDNIGKKALAAKNNPPRGTFMEIDAPMPTVHLPMERPPYSPPVHLSVNSILETGDGASVDSSALFDQMYINIEHLRSLINRELQEKPYITLKQLVDTNPLEKGLAELIGYVSIAGTDRGAVFDESVTDAISWTDTKGVIRKANIPRIIFNRT